MMRPFLAALLAVSLLACGGDHAATEPPPPLPPAAPPITRLVLQDTSALLFTGSAVPGQAFVAHAYDADGHEVAHPQLTLAAGAGWTVRGDTLIAPATEGRTTLRVSAKRAAPATGDWVHLDVVGADSVATDSMAVTAGIDLRASHWTVTYICRFTAPQTHPVGPPGVYLDSVGYDHLAVDSVTYASDAGWYPQWGGVAQVWFSGPITRWMSNDSSDVFQLTNGHMTLAGQGPDTLYWGGPEHAAALAQPTPRRYVGANDYVGRTLCSGDGEPTPLTFEEAP